MDYSLILKFFTALLAVMNPFAILPLFIDFTDTSNRRKTKNISILAIAIIMILTLFAGNKILRIFGITTGAFEATGGIIIFLMALAMAQGTMSTMQGSKTEEKTGNAKDDPSVVPLAMPLLGGPGTIATIIVYHNYFPGTEGYLTVSGVLVAALLVVWTLFSFAGRINKLLGETGIKIVSRVMGIMLAAIAMEMIVNGLKDLLPL